MAQPKFLIVGAAKSGTTSLFNYLNQHPDVYIPQVKECRFFSQLSNNFNGLGAEFYANSGITDEKEYFHLFEECKDKVCGDISNDYLYYYEKSIINIKKYLDDDVKIVIILRNPVDRAYSNYIHHIRDGWEGVNFEGALKDEKRRIKDNWGWSYHYVKTGMYFRQVEAYLDNFKNVKIYLFDDLNNKEVLLKNLYEFLDINPMLEFNNDEKFNVSGFPKNNYLHNFINKDNLFKSFIKPIVKVFLPKKTIQILISKVKNNNLEKKDMEMPIREELKEIFKDDINKLSALIGRDLSHWLS
jgi:hypothetical protein